MKCGREDMALPDESGESVAFGEGFYIGAGFYDARGADVDHFQLAAGQSGVRRDDGAVVLTSIGIAFDGGIEDGEAFLRGIEHFFCQQNAASAGAEGRLLLYEGLQRGEEAVAGQELEERGRFAAGNDEAVDVGKLFWLAYENGLGSGFFKSLRVCVIVALNGEDTDARPSL